MILLLTGSLYASNPQQQSSDSQNMCILKHMLTAYTGNDILSFSNMANLFDAITLGYHQEANPTHMSESEVEKDEVMVMLPIYCVKSLCTTDGPINTMLALKHTLRATFKRNEQFLFSAFALSSSLRYLTQPLDVLILDSKYVRLLHAKLLQHMACME